MKPPVKKLKKLAGLAKPPQKPSAKGGGWVTAAKGGARKESHWPALDATEISFRPGELILVAGRSAHGKTNFLLNLALNWLEKNPSERYLFYSLEMTPAQAASRLLANLVARRHGLAMGAQQALRYLKGDKAPDQVKAAMGELERIEERLAFVYEPLWDVEKLAADLMQRGGENLGGIFVDAISSLAVPVEKQRVDRRDLELAYIGRRLKELAVRFKAPLLAAAPTRPLRHEEGEELRSLIAKGREFRDMEVEDAIRGRRPRLSHLAESSLEQEADLLLGLLAYLSDFQSEMEPDHRALFTSRTSGILEVSALKNRLGSLDTAELEMDNKTSLIRDNPNMKSL